MRRNIAFLLIGWLILSQAFAQDNGLSGRTYLMINSKRQLLGLPALALRENTDPARDLEMILAGVAFDDVERCKGDCLWSVLILENTEKAYYESLKDLEWPYFDDDKKQISIASAIDPGSGNYISIIYVY